MSNKQYLGDAVYIEYTPETQEIKLTTSNGITDTNTIIMECVVLDAFMLYIDKIRSPQLTVAYDKFPDGNIVARADSLQACINKAKKLGLDSDTLIYGTE